jgi:hypothetical protein
MLRTIVRLEKLAALRRRFQHQGMLLGSTAGYIARSSCKADNVDEDGDMSMNDGDFDLMDADTNDIDGEQVGMEDQDAGKERLGL